MIKIYVFMTLCQKNKDLKFVWLEGKKVFVFFFNLQCFVHVKC